MATVVSSCGNWKKYGADHARLVIAGHSHTYALYSAIQNSQDYLDKFAVISHENFLTRHIHDFTYWDFVAQESQNAPLAILWNGNQHNIHFLIDIKEKFNLYDLIIEEEAPFITKKQLDQLFSPTFFELELTLERLSKCKDITLVGTPPPKTKKFLDLFIKSDGFFLKLGEELEVDKNKITASSNMLRNYMWQYTQNVTKEIARKFNHKFLPCPENTYDESYTLLPQYYSDDLTHANETFGLELVKAFENFYGIK